MVEDISRIDWEALEAPEVSAFLRRMYDEQDDEAFFEAYDKLKSYIYSDGISDAWDWGAPARMMKNDLPHQVTPFLIDILSHTKNLSKQRAATRLLRLLCTYWEVRGWTLNTPYHEAYKDWARRLLGVIREGVPIYQRSINDPDPVLNSYTKELLDFLEQTKEQAS